MYMYYPHRSQMPVRVRRFIDFVVEAARGAEQSLSRLSGSWPEPAIRQH
jgi:hypothetical protein